MVYYHDGVGDVYLVYITPVWQPNPSSTDHEKAGNAHGQLYIEYSHLYTQNIQEEPNMALVNKFHHFFGGIYSGKIQIFRFSIALHEKKEVFFLELMKVDTMTLKPIDLCISVYFHYTIWGGG